VRTPNARFCQRCGHRFDAVSSSDLLIGEVLLGRYRVLQVLGEGSMGRVYLGEQRVGESTRRVAIKVLAAARGNDDYIIARFRREATTIASLEHPNIIRLYDYGEESGRFLSIMEYVPGGSLAALIARGSLAPARVEAITRQIAHALDAAHQKGIVHRDLKPENVLLASTLEQGGADVVKVVDFGIARRPPSAPGERPLTITGAMMGTPAFMAPEQFMGGNADGRVDVYALGLVVYMMLSGRLPWACNSVMEWGDAHMNQSPRLLRTQPGCEALPERYDVCLARALAKDPRHRTPTAPALAQELAGTPGEPTQATSRVVGAAPIVDEAPVFPSRGSSFAVVFAVVLAVVLVLAAGGTMVYRALNAPSASSSAQGDAQSDALMLHTGLDVVPAQPDAHGRRGMETGVSNPTVVPQVRVRNATKRSSSTSRRR
jgi:serine/threonine-protein kinase